MIEKIISHYKIIEKLGEGGMGILYKAEDLKLHRNVALKFLPIELTSNNEAKKRFIREAQAASALQHNNICTIHEIDETNKGQIFISMDYYEGETLKNKICNESLSVDEIINITTQIADGLNKAHEKGIIHRDIKPANIFITKDDTIKILDFGLAKRIDQTQFTRTGMKFGTTDYMSPEQIKGEKIDLRTDIWSLGIILYEMLAGQQPFKADYEQAIVYLILNQEPEDARKFREDIPEKLLDILEKSIAKDREDRYEDLGLMIDDLKNVKDEKENQSYQFELPAPRPSQSIAVLPFINMSADPEQEYFCDGLTEELINMLSKIRDLKVVARTSAFAFKGGSYDVRKIGRKLDVKTVLEGSVRKSGDQLRITAQLINVNDGYQLWSERYDRELKDIFKIQDDISFSIVEVLKLKLIETDKAKMVKRYTDNLEAYNLVQQGNYYLNYFNFSLIDKAFEYYNKAIEKDPNFALAYNGLAGCYLSMSWFGLIRTSESLPQIKKYIQKSLEIDENNSVTYMDLGFMLAAFEWKWAEGEKAYRRGLELDPNDINILNIFIINRVNFKEFDFARKLAKRALTIDPVSGFTDMCATFPDFYEKKYEPVIKRLSKYVELNPPFWWGLWFLWRTLFFTNRKEEAVEVCKKSFMSMNMHVVVDEMNKAGVENAIYMAACAMAEIYKHHYVSPYNIAILFINAGKKEEAFNWLDISINEIDPQAAFINADPDWDSVRNDDHFIRCMKRIGLIT